MTPSPAASFDALLDLLAALPPERPVLRWFDPGGPAADPQWRSLSGPDLARRVEAVAANLAQAGLQAGDRIAWLGLNGWL